VARSARLVCGALLLAGCGVRADSVPHDVPEANQADFRLASGTDASGANRIYLVGPGEDRLLRSVSRDAESSEDLIEILLLGPNPTELSDDFSTAIPRTLQVLSTREQSSFLHLDVTEELTELSPAGLVQALAQIVYTASELEGIESVAITVRGEQVSWPKGNFESTTEPLRTYDYPGLVRSAQPAYPSVPSGG
jgi:hypothetical protein